MNDPIARFLDVFDRALATDLPEPTAMTLATADAAGRPSARMVLLKQVDERGFVFFTNVESRKGRELEQNPHAALCFHWQPLEIQVRVEGPVSAVTAAEADAYFASRGRGSQLGAWASIQSRPLAGEDDLRTRLAEVTRRFADLTVERPPNWSGFRVEPSRIEFWTARADRLHDREVYLRQEGGWRIERLYP